MNVANIEKKINIRNEIKPILNKASVDLGKELEKSPFTIRADMEARTNWNTLCFLLSASIDKIDELKETNVFNK